MPYASPIIDENEARRIIEDVDVVAFRRYMQASSPFDMDEEHARRRLEFYRDVELPNSPNSANFYLARNVSFGASDAANLAVLYADSVGINLSKETGMDLYFANIYEFIRTKIGRQNPQGPTPYTVQGHRMEPVIRLAMEQDHGFTSLPEVMARVNNYVHPDRELMRVSLDDFMVGPDGKAYVVDAKAVQGENFEHEKDMHHFQSQSQIRHAIDSGVAEDFEFGGAIMAYYNWTKARVEPVVIHSDEAVQELIIAGYHIAVQHVEHKVVPIYVPEKPSGDLSESERLKAQRLMHVIASLKSAQKALDTDTKAIQAVVVKTLEKSKSLPGMINRAAVIEDSPVPSAAIRVTDKYDFDLVKVKEETERRNITDDFMVVSREQLKSPIGLITELASRDVDISEHLTDHRLTDVPGLLATARNSGVDLEPYMSIEFDMEAAIAELKGKYNVSEDLLKTRKLGISSIDTVSSKNEAAQDYGLFLDKGVKAHIGDFKKDLLNANEMEFKVTEKQLNEEEISAVNDMFSPAEGTKVAGESNNANGSTEETLPTFNQLGDDANEQAETPEPNKPKM